MSTPKYSEGEVLPLRGRSEDVSQVSSSAAEAASDEELLHQVSLRRRRFAGMLWLARLAMLGTLLVVWEWLSGDVIRPFWISSPVDIASRIGEWLGDGTLVRNLLATLQVMVLGFVIGVSLSVVTGFILGRSEMLARLLTPFIQGIYSIPKLAFAPLFILWFGIGMTSKILLTVMIVFFMVFYNTFSGVRDVDPDLLDMAAVFGASRSMRLRKVVLPSAAEWIFTGLRLAVPYSLVGAVVGEILAGNEGIGYLVRNASGNFDTTGTFAALFSLIVVGMVINAGVEWSSRHTGRWKAIS